MRLGNRPNFAFAEWITSSISDKCLPGIRWKYKQWFIQIPEIAYRLQSKHRSHNTLVCFPLKPQLAEKRKCSQVGVGVVVLNLLVVLLSIFTILMLIMLFINLDFL